MTDLWVAISAVATAGLLLIGWLQYRKITTSGSGPRSRELEFEVRGLSGEVPDHVRGTEIGARVTAESLCFHNNSNNELKNVRLRISPLSRVWSAKVEWTDSLAKEAILLQIDEASLSIVIDSLPEDESFEVHIFSNDYYFGLDRVKSENSNVILRPAVQPIDRWRKYR